ncbi:MAG: CRISPR-associated helicase Cas3' [Chloroflexi bacterium]|nr:CRISPR-associated helicase Cas3' [Chloroflexota bacterium]
MGPPSSEFAAFFQLVTGDPPRPFQERLALQADWPEVLRIPTGAGKTAAVGVAWLWCRLAAGEEVRRRTPRRLVYVLPMRVLVEQVSDRFRGWIDALREAGWSSLPEVEVLMGGELPSRWEVQPERDQILVGTQDMILSAALNRSYASNRFRWPIYFGLLNNDTLWVLDEVQLMGPGLPTSAQLDAFRRGYGTYGPTASIWMSATVRPDWIETVDRPAPQRICELTDDDLKDPALHKALTATKTVWELKRVKASNREYPEALARAVLELHKARTRTLVMLNTVQRAQAVYTALRERLQRAERFDQGSEPVVILLHSRFRPPDRAEHMRIAQEEAALSPGGLIVVSTQVLEAGVDLSAATLVTELAPWASVVQRLGRCNRYGEEREACVYWIDLPERMSAPYGAAEMAEARGLLKELEGRSADPLHLPAPASPLAKGDVLRRRDLRDLFDTAPDLSGNETDITRFIRDPADRDLFVAWREWPGKEPDPAWTEASAQELCKAPLEDVRRLLQMRRRVAAWDFLERQWRPLRPSDPLFPGQLVVLDTSEGGYDPDLGWNATLTAPVAPVGSAADETPEAVGSDGGTWEGIWQELAEHAEETAQEMKALLDALDIGEIEAVRQDLELATRCHDLGKAHQVFQEAMLDGLADEERETRRTKLWAKRPGKLRKGYKYPHFRHELASLLGLLPHQEGEEGPALSDLALYLVLSHHGKVRLGIRSFPGERRLDAGPGEDRVLGIATGDELPRVDLGGGLVVPATRLDLEPVMIGTGRAGPSWLERSLSLLETLGPFRLAFLEALVRAADARASQAAQEREKREGERDA